MLDDFIFIFTTPLPPLGQSTKAFSLPPPLKISCQKKVYKFEGEKKREKKSYWTIPTPNLHPSITLARESWANFDVFALNLKSNP